MYSVTHILISAFGSCTTMPTKSKKRALLEKLEPYVFLEFLDIDWSDDEWKSGSDDWVKRMEPWPLFTEYYNYIKAYG